MTKLSAVALLATLVLSGCTSGPPEPTEAEFTMTVTPVPLVVRWGCPVHAPTDPPPTQCFLSMDPVISIREGGGVGGNILHIFVSMRDAATNAELVGIMLDRNWVVSNAGTDRIDANTTLAFRAVVNNYPLRYAPRPSLKLVVAARLVDDKGNETTPSFNADIN